MSPAERKRRKRVYSGDNTTRSSRVSRLIVLRGLALVHDGMMGAVTQPGATAYLAFRGALYKLAGKTGTAQVVTVKQTESTKHQDADVRKREHAWFIAFAPVEDPKIAISVLVENGGFGGSTAGPIARKVLDTYLLADESSEPKKNLAEIGMTRPH